MKIQYHNGAKTYWEAVNHKVSYPSYSKTCYTIVEGEKVIGMFSFSIGYMFCCGMREIGGFDGPLGDRNFDADEVKQFSTALCELMWDNYLNGVGALTLTENISRNGVRLIPRLWQQLIDTWPKASHSQPFYNPNSDNTVIQWVLPIPGKTTREEWCAESQEEDY